MKDGRESGFLVRNMTEAVFGLGSEEMPVGESQECIDVLFALMVATFVEVDPVPL